VGRRLRVATWTYPYTEELLGHGAVLLPLFPQCISQSTWSP
jgi:hypothetical protein